MRVCVVGAGSIGGLIGVHLARRGHEVTLIVRGANLAAVRANGMTVIDEDGSEHTERLAVTDRIADAGKQDLVILGMKAHQVAAVVPELPALYDDDTMVMTAQNGIPWWYFQKHGGPFDGRHLQSVDPGGVIAAGLPCDRVVASVIYPAAYLASPGVVRHVEGRRISIGEIDNSDTPRIARLSAALREAGFKSPVLSDIRAEIWTKLWGNLSFNPISALTHATLEEICRLPRTRELAAAMMNEAQAVAEKLGIRFKVSLEKRLAGAEAVGAHKTSMLQDVEQGRRVELEALVGSVVELARLTDTATPHIDAVLACMSLLDQRMAATNGKLVMSPRD
jgi:2-dehydropantoate 2-reductase